MGIITNKLHKKCLSLGSTKAFKDNANNNDSTEIFNAKYGGDLRPTLILNKSLNDGHRYFDSADWSMNKGSQKVLSELPHKVQPTRAKPKTPRKMVFTKHMLKTDSAREWTYDQTPSSSSSISTSSISSSLRVSNLSATSTNSNISTKSYSTKS